MPASGSGVTAALVAGILSVQGTDGDDFIRIRVRSEGPRQIDLIEVEGVSRPFRAGRVRLVVVAGGAGNDTIIMDDLGRGIVPVWFDGGPGNDFLVGGGADDVLLGGEGNDAIFGNGDNDYIDAGPGQNIINGLPEVFEELQLADVETGSEDDGLRDADISPIALSLVEATNQERIRFGREPLQVAASLTSAANLQAREMARLNQFDHELPGSPWPTLRDRVEHVGYDYATIGENLAFNYPSAEAVVKGWMTSAGHRSNLLKPDFTEVGVAISENVLGQLYYVQVLGRPR